MTQSNDNFETYFFKCMSFVEQARERNNDIILPLEDEKLVTEFVSYIYEILCLYDHEIIEQWIIKYNMQETMGFVLFFMIKMYKFEEIKNFVDFISSYTFSYALAEINYLRGKRTAMDLRKSERDELDNLTLTITNIINAENLKDFNSSVGEQFNSKEQAKFYVLLPEYRYLTKKKEEGLIDAYQDLTLGDISVMLYGLVVRFAYDQIKRMTKECYFTYEQRQDLDSIVKTAFFAHVNDYDPIKTTPTTFFVQYFIEAIRTFIQYCMRMTPYDATNARELKNIINEYAVKDDTFTIDDLAERTNMTDTVIKNTLNLMRKQQVDFENVEHKVENDEPSFEKDFFESINEKIIEDMINDTLTEKEAKLFRLRMYSENPNKINTYQAVSVASGLSIHDVRETLNTAKRKIKESDVFKRYWGRIHLGSNDSTVDNSVSPVKTDSSRLAESQISNFFNNSSSPNTPDQE